MPERRGASARNDKGVAILCSVERTDSVQHLIHISSGLWTTGFPQRWKRMHLACGWSVDDVIGHSQSHPFDRQEGQP